MRQLNANAFVVGAVVIKRIGQLLENRFGHLDRRWEARALAGARVLAHHLLIFNFIRGRARLCRTTDGRPMR